MKRINVLVVDDHPLFRRGILGSLESEPDILVVGEAADGRTALQQADLLLPDVVVVDINLPEVNGLEVTRSVRGRHPQTAVVVLTMHQDDEQLFHAVRAGAAAFLSKDADGERIVAAIRGVARGEYLIDDGVLTRPAFAARVADQFRNASQDADNGSMSPLTPREFDILDCLARGNSNKEIAKILAISDQTVKNHITSILRKLAVSDRTQALVHALRHGWIKAAEEPVEP